MNILHNNLYFLETADLPPHCGDHISPMLRFGMGMPTGIFMELPSESKPLLEPHIGANMHHEDEKQYL